MKEHFHTEKKICVHRNPILQSPTHFESRPSLQMRTMDIRRSYVHTGGWSAQEDAEDESSCTEAAGCGLGLGPAWEDGERRGLCAHPHMCSPEMRQGFSRVRLGLIMKVFSPGRHLL